MKQVLIVGAGSYIGTHIAQLLRTYPDEYSVRELDVRGGLDAEQLNQTDIVIHVAGIAHRREADVDPALYTAVNRDLAVLTAREAAKRGVHQFLFFSSMSVYGLEKGTIKPETQPSPKTLYGISKWKAEQEIAKLQNDQFHVFVLRPPMVYGPGCPGNFGKLAAFALKLPCFPRVGNQRSMIYIETLAASVLKILRQDIPGMYYPQNPEYADTSMLVQCVAEAHGKKLMIIPGFGWLICLLARVSSVFAKVFGSLIYEKDMSTSCMPENTLSFQETIRLTEVGK